MDFQIALMLVQDGVVNGAIYALMALALVLVFSVTRVIFIPQGEFVAYAALAMAALQGGQAPPVPRVPGPGCNPSPGAPAGLARCPAPVTP